MRKLGGAAAPWVFDATGITDVDPGAGNWRADSANLNALSAFNVSTTDAASRDLSVSISPDAIGTLVMLSQIDGTDYAYGTITAAAKNTGYNRYTFTLAVGKGIPATGDLWDIRFYPPAPFGELNRFRTGFE